MSLVIHEEVNYPGAMLSGPDNSGRFPEWFVEEQRTAWDEFQSLPAPNRKDQPWCFSNVSLLDLDSFQRVQPVPDNLRRDILERSHAVEEVAGRLVFAGNELILRDVVSEKL